MSVEKLYEAVKSGRIKPDQLNDKGKSELRNFIMSKNGAGTPTPAPSVVRLENPTPSLEEATENAGYSLKPQLSMSGGIPTPQSITENITKPRPVQKPVSPAAGQRLIDIPANVAEGTGDSIGFGLPQNIMRRINNLLVVNGKMSQGEADQYDANREKRESTTAYKVGQFAGYIPPGATIERGIAAVAKPVIQNLPRFGKFAATGAAAGLVEGAAQEGADVAFRQDSFDPENVAISGALGGALGAATPAIGAGLQRLIRFFRPQQAPTPQGPTLALPAPKTRGNVNTVDAPEVINVPETGPRALPAPNVAPPTTARIARAENPYRAKLEQFAEQTKGMQLPPGRERETLLEAWGRFAGPNDPDLESVIDLSYPSRPNQVTPDLVSRARETQRAREVAGAPLPVRSMSDRYQGGVTGNAAPIVSTAGRRTGQAMPTTTPRTSVGPVQARMNETSAASEVISRPRTPTSPPQQRGFINTLSQSGRLSDEAKEALQSAPNARYKPVTNADTVSRANKRIEDNIDAAEGYVLSGKKGNPEQIATGMRLIDEFQRTGNTERAVTVALNISKKLTEAGQTVQAASIWNRLSPEGALLAAARKVDELNESASRFSKPLEITKKTGDDIKAAAMAIQRSGASKERAAQVMDIADRLKNGGNITTEERELVSEFVKDLQSFVKPSRPPRPPRMPREMNDKRIRDRVVSFMDEQEKAAKERLRARGIQISSTPLDVWADYAVIGASKLTKGVRNFADWSDQMVRELGESVRPHLEKIYESAHEYLTQNTKKISDRAVSRAEQIAESYVRKNEAKLKPEDAEFIRNMARNVSELSGEQQRIASQDLQAIMNGFEKSGFWRKVSAAQYIFMLLNPKTQIRNIIGNELLYRLERLARVIATPIDIAASKITGGPRTVTFRSGPRVWDDFFTPAKDYWTNLPKGAEAGARGVSPEGLTTKYEIQGPAFRSKYNPMTYLEKALGASLQGFDYAAYTRATNQRLREMSYLDAINNGVKGADNIRRHMQTFMVNMDDAVHTIAKDYGKYATLQDDSVLASKLMGLRRGLNKITLGNENFGAGNLIVPFAKTPANLLLRGLDYSPIGILKSAKQVYDILLKKNTDLTRADVISSVSRAIMGSGMGALAYWLADKGAMWGQSNKDSETRKLQQMTGMRDFQINATALQRMVKAIATGGNVDEAAKIRDGDTLWGYEWAQPTSMPMAIGSNIHQSRKSGSGFMQTAGEAAMSGIGTLLDSSVLSGIREAFQIYPGEDNAWKAIAMNLIEQVPGMFTPSFVKNINTLMDERIKETYTPDPTEKLFSYTRSNIPGLSQKMPQRVDTLGNPQTKSNSFFDVFVSPADRSKYKPTPEAKFVLDLLNETGDTRIAPRSVQKNITGRDRLTGEQRKIDLSPEQYVKIQTIVGQETARLISKINPMLPTDRKIERVIDALDQAGEKGRKEMKRDLGLRP